MLSLIDLIGKWRRPCGPCPQDHQEDFGPLLSAWVTGGLPIPCIAKHVCILGACQGLTLFGNGLGQSREIRWAELGRGAADHRQQSFGDLSVGREGEMLSLGLHTCSLTNSVVYY